MKAKKQEQKKKKTTRNKPNKTTKTKEAERQEFIKFVALPKPFRLKEFGYENDADFAKDKKVNTWTLVEWKKDEEFWEEVRKHWKRWGKDKTPNVIIGLYQKAVRDGNASEVLAWMKIIEDWRETQELKHTGGISLTKLFEETKDD